MRCPICKREITEHDVMTTLLGRDRVHLDCLGESPPRTDRPEALVEAKPPAKPRTQREQLDDDMQEVLLQLMMCSHVPAGPYEPIGRSREADGGARPPGELGAEPWLSQKYDRCETDVARAAVLEEARDVLKAIRQGPDERPAAEMDAEDWLQKRNKEIVRDGVGLSITAAATRWRCGERDIIKARRDAGKEPEFGTAPEFTGGRQRGAGGRYEDADTDAKRERALELDAKGYSIAAISVRLGVHRSTVERYLGKRAA